MLIQNKSDDLRNEKERVKQSLEENSLKRKWVFSSLRFNIPINYRKEFGVSLNTVYAYKVVAKNRVGNLGSHIIKTGGEEE